MPDRTTAIAPAEQSGSVAVWLSDSSHGPTGSLSRGGEQKEAGQAAGHAGASGEAAAKGQLDQDPPAGESQARGAAVADCLGVSAVKEKIKGYSL